MVAAIVALLATNFAGAVMPTKSVSTELCCRRRSTGALLRPAAAESGAARTVERRVAGLHPAPTDRRRPDRTFNVLDLSNAGIYAIMGFTLGSEYRSPHGH